MKIFSLLFGAIYYACVWQIDWALVYYYPETNKWYMTAHPDDGAAILFFSSELAEFPLVCDRVLTVYGGRVTAELPGAAADEATLLQAMHGLQLDEAVA